MYIREPQAKLKLPAPELTNPSLERDSTAGKFGVIPFRHPFHSVNGEAGGEARKSRAKASSDCVHRA